MAVSAFYGLSANALLLMRYAAGGRGQNGS